MTSPTRTRRFGLVWLILPMLSAAWLHLGPMMLRHVVGQDAAAVPNKIVDAPQPDKNDTKAFNELFTTSTDPGKVPPAAVPLIDKMVLATVADFTQPATTDAPSGATKKRSDGRRKIAQAWPLPVKDLHKALNLATINQGMPIVLDKDVSPVARTNILLLIGSLDRQEREGATQAIALPEGTLKLIEVIKNNDLPAYLHVAAAESMVRHAELETTPPQRKEMIAALLPFLSTERPANYDVAGWTWLRKRAANIAALFAEKNFSEANDPALIAGLINVMSDDKVSFNTRLDAAVALGAFDGKAVGPKVKEGLVGVGDTARAMLLDCADDKKARPLVVHVLQMLMASMEVIKREPLPDVGGVKQTVNEAKGLAAGADANQKNTALTLRGKFQAGYKQIVDLKGGPYIDAVHRPVLDQIATDIDAIVKPLRGNAVAAAAPVAGQKPADKK
jgi:hypothetical protein